MDVPELLGGQGLQLNAECLLRIREALASFPCICNLKQHIIAVKDISLRPWTAPASQSMI